MTTAEMIQILTGFVGTAGFSVLFNIKGKKLAATAVGGLLSWTLFVILARFIESTPLCYFIVAVAVTVYSEIMARVLKTPTTVFTATSLVPLIPGGSLYYTMSYAFQSDMTHFLSKGIDTLKLGAALALGIVVTSAVIKTALNIRQKHSIH